MGRMTLETRRRVITLHSDGVKLKDIQSHLKGEGIAVSKTSLCLLIKKYKNYGVISDFPRPLKETILSPELLMMIDDAVAQDDEISTPELRAMLHEAGVQVLISTIQWSKRKLGMFTTSRAYAVKIFIALDPHVLRNYSTN